MELKFGEELQHQIVDKVLIVPLWNWNDQRQKRLGALWGSNCTFMELKYVNKTNAEAKNAEF